MEGLSPFWLAGGGVLLLLIGYRAVKKKRILGSSGEIRSSSDLSFYLRVGGFWLSGLLVLVLAAMTFQQQYGWSSVLVYVLFIGLLVWLFLRAKSIRKGIATGIVTLLKPRARVKRKQSREMDTSPRTWALAAAALPATMRGLDHQTLAGRSLSPANEKRARRWLKKEWEIDDEEEFQEVQDWLMETGHRTEFFEEIERFRLFSDEYREGFLRRIDAGEEEADTPQEQEELKARVKMAAERAQELTQTGFMAWDFLRFLDNCRAGFLAGYIEEDEAWDAMIGACQVLQSRYDSWEECAEAFLMAREYWSSVETEANGMAWRKALLTLRENPKSPWNMVPWELALFSRK